MVPGHARKTTRRTAQLAATPYNRRNMPDPTTSRAEPSAQTAEAVLMVRPASFGWNAETRPSNRFQRDDATLAGRRSRARAQEFDGLVAALRGAGVDVRGRRGRARARVSRTRCFRTTGSACTPTARSCCIRCWRRADGASAARAPSGSSSASMGRRVHRLLDLTHHELHGRFLEGTGSVVFDHVARVAYAALSPRTHRGAARRTVRGARLSTLYVLAQSMRRACRSITRT